MSKDNDMAQANETETIKPTWAQIQAAVSEASCADAQQEVAWDRYQQAKQALTESDAYRIVEEAQKDWHERLAVKVAAIDKRDAILKAALGITDEEVTQPE